MPFELPDLPYAYDALEPFASERTMRIHHDKHHAGYTRKLNAALDGHADLEDEPIEDLLGSIQRVPTTIRQDVRNNGGGYANHALFWQVLSPKGGGEPTGALSEALDDQFGSFDHFQDRFEDEAKGVFGSGWAWLTVTGEGELHLDSTPNQDSPLMNGQVPVLGLDVWEHAYYLTYQNERGRYVRRFWAVVDWDEVQRRFEEAVGE
jgi:Fe-Mn family superoxide dismutase